MKFIKFVSLALFIVIVVVALSYEKIIARVLLPQYIEWAHETDMKGLKIGQPLNEQELALAAEIGIKQAVSVWARHILSHWHNPSTRQDVQNQPDGN